MTDLPSTQTRVHDRYLQTCGVTVQVPTPSAQAQAADAFATRLRGLHGQVEPIVGEDAASALVEALREVGHDAGETLVATATREGDTHVWASGEVLPERVVEGPLPDLGGLLAAQQTWLPHAVVLVDRVGADIRIVTEQGTAKELTADGETQHITKSQPGGWSQRRFQQRAEEQWEENADLVAGRVADEVGGAGIGLVLVAGDETIRPILRDALPTPVAEMVTELETGGRAEDGSAEALEAAVDAAVRDAARDLRVSRQRQVLDAIGQGDGVQGREDVLRALFEGRADTVVVHLDDAADLMAHFGPEPQQVAADAGDLHALDLDAQRAPLADVVLRGAAATGAVPVVAHEALADLTDGVGASLRG